MYKVTEASSSFRELLNPRRGASRSAPLLDWGPHLTVQDELFARHGLEEYIGCITGEMGSRPIPHAFRTEQVRPLTELYLRRAPALLQRVLSLIEAPLQPLNKTSRLGWDSFKRPLSKKAAVMPWFERLIKIGAAEALAEAFIIMNVRLQPEPKAKKRKMLFIDRNGVVTEREVTAEDRTMMTKGGERVCARTRLVFNMPIANLLKQILDTAIHNVLLSYPVFHHNMYSPTGTLPVTGTHLCFDVAHFERHTAELVRARGMALIGGLYGDITKAFASIPFLVPSDDWKKYFFIMPDRAAGWSDQFASGDSAVAPAQKEVFFCLYQEFAERVLGVPPSESFSWVMKGGDSRLTIRNYGDDNSVNGDPGVLKELLPFMQQYLEAAEEPEPKFLGFQWDGARWRLTAKSYLLKTYLNERRPNSAFRPFPCFGWVEKRGVYARYGSPNIAGLVFPDEEKTLLLRGGLPWSKLLREASKESQILASRHDYFRDPSWLLGKDYLLSSEQKVRMGLFEGLTPAETAPLLRALLPERWKETIRG